MVSPHPLPNLFRRSLVLIACLAAAISVKAEDAPPFPTDPNAWINSGPLTVEGLKGKGIVIWFFEEDSDKCRGLWPDLMKTAEKYSGRPLVFIAVNSGNQRVQVEAYVQAVEIKSPWVVLVDSSRDFEKACQLIKEITPDNFCAIRYIKPDGEILPGLTDDLEEAAKKASEGAEWKVNANIPDSLKGTWMAVEIGNFKGLAVPLRKAVASSKPDIKEAGKLLMDVVQKEMSDQMAAIKAAQEAGNPYRAYEVVNGMSEHFKGFELPKEISQLKRDLSKDQKVKNGVKAATSLEAARKHLAAGEGEKNKAYEKAIKALEEIVADYPDTALAKQAKGLLDYAK